MNDDGALLRQFAETRDEAALRQLIERRIGFVFAVNLRRLRDPHLAEDATQAVFVALTRKAASVARCPSVIGWLHRSSCYESRNLMRAQANRLARETEAQRLGMVVSEPRVAPNWPEIEGVLDEVLGELPEADREAILERYFSHRSFAEIGATTGRTENAARMRVDRALAKLRDRLRRRGFESTAAVLATALPSYATAGVPSGLSATVTNAALAGLGAAATPLAFLAFMNTTKIAVTVAAVLAAGAIGFEFQQTRKLEHELRALHQQHAQSVDDVRGLTAQIDNLKARAASIEKTASASASQNASAAAVVAPPESPEVPGITRKPPAGWNKNGSNPRAYDVGVDQLQTWGGMPSAYVKSNGTGGSNEFGGMMQAASAESYKNQRVRLTGWMKTQDANDGGGHLWLRVDGQNGAEMLQFDNMNNRAPKGTTDWQEYSIVLDVPENAAALNYGFFMGGKGQMWVNGVTLQPVTTDVPTTNMLSQKRVLPKAPVNLGFSPAPTN